MICQSSAIITAMLGAFLLFQAPGAYAQDWGKISDEEWVMAPPPQYPEAAAIVLVDNGELEVNASDMGGITLARYVRIKVFDKVRAEEYLTVEIVQYKGDKIKGLRAHTLTPDGKKTKVKKKEIFRKKIGSREVVTFTFPALADGVILEYEYRNHNKRYSLLDPWIFQGHLFVCKSRFSVVLQRGFTYSCVRRNVAESAKLPMNEQRDWTEFAWEMVNIMPTAPGPYTGRALDFQPSLYFQLQTYQSAHTHVQFAESWNDLGERLTAVFDEFTFHKKQMTETAARICAEASTEQEKIARLYEYVRDQLETRDRENSFSLWFEHGSVNDVLETRYGKAAEKNALLVGLLRMQGLDAYPVVIATRDHAKFNPSVVELWQLNRLLCYVVGEERTMTLDTAEPSIPFGCLPSYDLVNRGLLLMGKASGPTEILYDSRNNELEISAVVNLHADGSAICSTRVCASGYRIAPFYHHLQKPLDKESIQKELLFDENLAFAIADAGVSIDVANDSLWMDFVLTIDELCMANDELSFITPMLFSPPPNPFTADRRNSPIDFRYPFKTRWKTIIRMPDGMEITQAPDNISESMTSARFSRLVQHTTDVLEMKCILLVGNPLFPPERYQKLQEIFEAAEKSAHDQIAVGRRP